MSDLRSRDITSVPQGRDEFRRWAEEVLRDHFEDLKQLKEMVDMNMGWRFKRDDSGNLIIQEFNTTTKIWDDSGWQLDATQ